MNQEDRIVALETLAGLKPWETTVIDVEECKTRDESRIEALERQVSELFECSYKQEAEILALQSIVEATIKPR